MGYFVLFSFMGEILLEVITTFEVNTLVEVIASLEVNATLDDTLLTVNP